MAALFERPQSCHYQKIVTITAIAFLLASQFKFLISFTGHRLKDLENNLSTIVPVDAKTPANQYSKKNQNQMAQLNQTQSYHAIHPHAMVSSRTTALTRTRRLHWMS
mmetsp:Transcript_10236/g.17317  ORF Transcript_10236/g.17317 Transcript_10236/m.17317 type:complete len:107 (+) Transcript_10236:211-531(+)